MLKIDFVNYRDWHISSVFPRPTPPGPQRARRVTLSALAPAVWVDEGRMILIRASPGNEGLSVYHYIRPLAANPTRKAMLKCSSAGRVEFAKFCAP
eukprot:s12_g42.t1